MNPIMAALQQHLGGGAHMPPSSPVPPALMGAIGAGGGPGGPGLPPGLMAAIGHSAPDLDAGSPEEAPGHEQDEVQLLTKILDDMTTFLKVAADEDDKATIATCIANIQKLRAKDQAESDSAMKGQASPRLARKTAASVGGPGGGGL